VLQELSPVIVYSTTAICYGSTYCFHLLKYLLEFLSIWSPLLLSVQQMHLRSGLAIKSNLSLACFSRQMKLFRVDSTIEGIATSVVFIARLISLCCRFHTTTLVLLLLDILFVDAAIASFWSVSNLSTLSLVR